MAVEASWPLGAAVVLIAGAGVFSAVDAAISGFSRARAAELRDQGRPGAAGLVAVLAEPARYLNTVLLLRLLLETAAIVLLTLWFHDLYDGNFWRAFATTTGVMLLVSFVVVGVSPRTLGRQHETVALYSAGPLRVITSVLGPVPQLLILIGNALTPGKGFDEGPFNSETELREMVDLAEASSLIESGERKMLHSVFELGDTIVREVMVPRNDIVYIERHKNLRQAMSLFLRSGYSRVPVVGENLDDVIGMAYLKDVVQRDFDAPDVELVQQVEEVMRPVHHVPDSKPVDALLSELQARRQHIAVVIDEYGGTAGLVTIEDVLEEIVGEITDEYDEEETEVTHLENGAIRVSSRYPVDDLDEIVGVVVHDEDVDSVGGLMAKHLGRVPLPGAVVEAHGLRFEAERVRGRRNQIDTVLVQPVTEDRAATAANDDESEHDDE
ncbi:MAG: hemolysin family protein [Nocardioides sp.]|uniref:hemolysin family protein n=1 Tax=Nocardioides sp. TaxID=35761 RepID=UPI003F073647